MLKNYHFINNKKYTYIVLAVVLLIGIGSFLIKGFNIDIDFSGGSEIQLNIGKEVTNDICKQINGIIEKDIGHEYVSSTIASTADNNVAVIRTGTKPLELEQQTTLKKSLANAFPDANFDDIQVNVISASIGEDMQKTALLSVGIAVILMLVYIWIRFELVSGISAVLCLLHDLFIMFAAYSILQIPLNVNIIAALLTILGYSINSCIIVFDRVRENRRKYGYGKSFPDTVDLSIRQTMGRSINTNITTLLTIGMVYIFGVDSIRNFALPLIIGIVAGFFSSVFLAGLLWVEGEKFHKTTDKAVKPVKAVNTSK